MRREINYIPREKPHLVTRTLPEVTLNVLRANCVLAEGDWGITRLEATNCQNLFPFKALIVVFSSVPHRKCGMPVRISVLPRHLVSPCTRTHEIPSAS